MPRNYKRKTQKAQWSTEDLQRAVNAVESGVNIRQAGKMYNIPFSTLQSRLKKAKTNIGPKLGRNPVFSEEEERLMADHVKLLGKLFYGLTPKQLRRIAFEFAEQNGIPNHFNKEKEIAGKDWLYNFLRRNPTISKRKPENTSVNRMMSFNREEVRNFFDNLETVMEKYKFTGTRIYNMDETGISTVGEPEIILAEKGQKRIGTVASGERGKIVTVICSLNAAGNFVPPLFIFPRKRLSPLLMRDGPSDAAYHVSNNGWSNEELFVVWLTHFTKFVKPSKEDPVLLVLDNHGSHITLESYTFCKENGIVMVSIPPHTSHRLQPLDVVFYGPLKTAFKVECNLFIKSNALIKITHYDLASIFNKAYCTVATVGKAVSGFSSTGIFPMNPGVFTEEDFLAAETLHNASHQESIENHQNSTDPNAANLRSETVELVDSAFDDRLAFPSTSNKNMDVTKQKVTIELISPLPAALPTKNKKRATKKQHSQILTSTPFKKTMIEKKAKSEKSKMKKILKKDVKKTSEQIKKSRKKVRRESTDSESSLEDIQLNDDSTDDLSDYEEQCLICGDFGKNELWYRCTSCGLWAHSECSGVDSPVNYVCDFCSHKERVKSKLSF